MVIHTLDNAMFPFLTNLNRSEQLKKRLVVHTILPVIMSY